MRLLLLSFFSLFAGIYATPVALFSTQSAQINMTLALSITTSAGNNNQAESVIDMEKHTVRFSMKIKDFKFDNYFVESAFEDSYMEASKYPEANFQGKLKTPINLKIKTLQKIEVAGDLTMHGIKKTKSMVAHVTVVSPTQIKVTSDFVIKASEPVSYTHLTLPTNREV